MQIIHVVATLICEGIYAHASQSFSNGRPSISTRVGVFSARVVWALRSSLLLIPTCLLAATPSLGLLFPHTLFAHAFVSQHLVDLLRNRHPSLPQWSRCQVLPAARDPLYPWSKTKISCSQTKYVGSALICSHRLTISAQSDLTVTVVGAAGEDGIKHVTDLLLSSEACKKSAYVKALLEESKDKGELTFGGDAKSKDNGDNIEGTLVWLAHLHDLSQERMDDLGLFDITLIGVWHAISLWNFHMDGKIKEVMGPWFNDWYERKVVKAELTIPIAQALAYPCYVFDHAIGYARITKYLTYEHVGHIKERPPKGFKGPKHLHINEREFISKQQQVY
jgi:hypothetical protein